MTRCHHNIYIICGIYAFLTALAMWYNKYLRYRIVLSAVWVLIKWQISYATLNLTFDMAKK